MSKAAKAETTEAPATTSTGTRGRKVMLSDGTPRVDYIRDRWYKDGLKDEEGGRSKIVKELAEKFSHEVPYQIVFQATKETERPEPKEKAEKPAEEAKSD